MWERSRTTPSTLLLAVLPYVAVGVVAATVLDLFLSSIVGEPERILPQFDVATTEIKVFGALRLRQLTGAFSIFGFQHPGPWFFYWLAPFYALSGHRLAGLQFGMALGHVLALASTVAVVRRSAGRAMAVVLGVIIAVWTQRYGLEGFFGIWNPMVLSTGTILLMALIGALIAERDAPPRWLFASVIGLGSFLVQTHVGSGPFVLTVGLVAVWVTLRGRSVRELVHLVTPALIVAAVLWTPVVVDQVNGTGNLSDLYSYFIRGRRGDGDGADLFSLVQGNGPIHPRGILGPVAAAMSLRVDHLGDNAGLAIETMNRVHPTWLDGVLLTLLLISNVIAGWRVRIRSRFLTAMAGVSIAAVAGTLISAAFLRAPGFSLYQMHFVTGVGFWLWAVPVLAVTSEVLIRWRTTMTDRTGLHVASAVVLIAAGIVILTAPSRLSMVEYTRSSPADVFLEAEHDPRVVNVDARPDLFDFDFFSTVNELLRAGVEVHAPAHWRTVMPGGRTPTRPDAPTILLIERGDPPDDAELLGTWTAPRGGRIIDVYLAESETGLD